MCFLVFSILFFLKIKKNRIEKFNKKHFLLNFGAWNNFYLKLSTKFLKKIEFFKTFFFQFPLRFYMKNLHSFIKKIVIKKIVFFIKECKFDAKTQKKNPTVVIFYQKIYKILNNEVLPLKKNFKKKVALRLSTRINIRIICFFTKTLFKKNINLKIFRIQKNEIYLRF